MCWSCITNNALKIKITHAYMFSGPTYYIKYFHLPCMHVRCFALMNLITKVSMHCFINMQTWFFLLWMFLSRIMNIKKWEILRKRKLFIISTLLIWRSYDLFYLDSDPDRIIDEHSSDVDRICTIINKLFASDGTMEDVLDECNIHI